MGFAMKMIVFAAAACSLLLTGLPSAAQDAPSAIEKLRVSRALYDLGLAEEDPLLLLAAARLRKSAPLDPVQRTPEGGTQVSGDPKPLSWQDILDEAAPLIEGDPALEGLAEDIALEGERGVSDGAVYSIANIQGRGENTYPDLTFSGGDFAEVYVEGPSGSDLNILIHDSQGRLVCSDTDPSAIAHCGWYPTTQGRFKVTVENRGDSGAEYSLITN